MRLSSLALPAVLFALVGLPPSAVCVASARGVRPAQTVAAQTQASGEAGVPSTPQSSATSETATAVRAQNDPRRPVPTESGDDPKGGERTRENERGSTDVNRPN
jgi:hypothetical protein